MIKETIVVEGKSDMIAVRKAVDADIIITGGMGFSKSTIELIKKAQASRGVIILTDPDYAGEKIRRIISDRVKGVKHAFVPLEEAQTEDDIGIENAAPDSIKKALSMARVEEDGNVEEFNINDMVIYGLSGQNGSATLRNLIGKILGIGYTNAKQFLRRLNRYGITREEFDNAYENIVNSYKEDEK